MDSKNKKDVFEKTFFQTASPPGFFVSWNNYPNITIAPLSSLEPVKDVSFLDDSQKWFGLNRQRIVSLRNQLLRSTFAVKATQASNPSQEISQMQLLSMASKPVDLNIELLGKPKNLTEFSDTIAPLGPKARLKKMELTQNPFVEKKVDYLVSDIDAKASVAVQELFSSNFSVGFISKLLSAGLLGVKKERKFVPTRWSITAADDMASAQLIEGKVKNFSQLGQFELFSSSYLDNKFFVLLVPSAWAFEQLEAWDLEKAFPSIGVDFEFFSGRKTYASNVAGAYYAVRLAVAEYLVKIKRQAAAIVFREIGPSYKTSLGVWVVRETVRNALLQKPIRFSDLNLALKFLEPKLSVPVAQYKKKSSLLDFFLHQKKLF